MPPDLLVAPGRLLTPGQAAGYLGISRETISRWQHAGKIPVVYLANRRPRFLISDLDACALKGLRYRHSWDPTDKEIPILVVQRLLGITEHAVWTAVQMGTLPDFTAKSIRAYIERQLTRKIVTHVRAKYEKIIYRGYSQEFNHKRDMAVLRARLDAATCIHCGKPNYRPHRWFRKGGVK